MGLFVFALFLCLSNALTIFIGQGSSVTSLNSPTSLMRRFYDNVDVSIFNQNYSVILSQNSLCGPAPAAAQGQVLYGNGVSVPCDLTVAQNYAIQGGVKAVYYAIFFCELFMLATDTQYALPPTVPFFASLGNPNPLNTPWPGVLSEPSLLIPAFAAKGANISIFLSSPQTNTLLQAFYDYNSPFQWVYAVNFTACCVLIVMASMKLRLFISHAGFVVQLPLLVLTSALCAGIIGVFQSQLGFFGWRSVIVQRNVYKFFEFWVFGFALQVSVMMGLYFKEVASLTSNSTIVGLGKMTVVAVPVLGFMWAFILITGSFNAAAQGNNISSPLMITMLSLFTVTAFVVVALTCWGSFSILRSIGGLDKRKWNLILTVVLSLLSMCLSIALGMVYVSIRVYPLIVLVGMTETQIVLLSEFSSIFCQVIAIAMVCFNFRVSVSKEIELSKSTTSSTSGTMTSSSMSSKSESSEPVIEL